VIDRIVHHAGVLTLKGNSYRFRNTDIDTLPSHRASGQGTITTTAVAYFGIADKALKRSTGKAGQTPRLANFPLAGHWRCGGGGHAGGRSGRSSELAAR